MKFAILYNSILASYKNPSRICIMNLHTIPQTIPKKHNFLDLITYFSFKLPLHNIYLFHMSIHFLTDFLSTQVLYSVKLHKPILHSFEYFI